MSNCKIVYDNQGNKIGVSENNQLFQEILNNPLNKDFDSALDIFLETYSPEIKYSIIGEIGAETLDKMEEVTFRLDNLKVAKEMQEAGKSPIIIKMATNWEQNIVDKLWRYEVPDGNLKNVEIEIEKEYKASDVIENNPIVDAYNDIKIKFYDNRENFTNAEAGFNPIERSVSVYLTAETTRFSDEGVTIMDDPRIFSSILHELTHAVQYSEGFGVGGSPRTMLEKATNLINLSGVETETQLLEKVNNALLEEKTDYEKTLLTFLQTYLNTPNIVRGEIVIPMYQRISGEVEARSIEARYKSLNKTILISDTLGISPEDQFYIKSALPTNQNSTLKYQTQDGQVFADYGEALRNTQGEKIEAGVNTTNGFKPLFTISSNTNVNTQQGLINYLIKSGIASGKTYTFNGKTHIIAEGKTSAKKTINAEIIKDTFQQKLGVKTAKLQADGSVLIDEDASRNKVRITNKKGEVVTVDLSAPFSELKKEFEPETIAQIFAGNTLNKAMSGRAIVKQEFVPEDKLQEMLMNLLKKFGIKTLSFEDYLKNYQIRNGLPVNARALADTANKLIAFKDGIIENDDLVEEVAHLIESSIPQEQKENILRNIHKTKEWGQFYEQYKNLYPTENELRREILGKVIANSIKEQFQARNKNITEDSIINKIKQFFDEFLARIRAYFQDSFQTELDNLTKEIYKNLEQDTLTLDLEGVNNIFFSDVNSSVSVDKIVEKTQKAIEIVKDQERLLAKKYKNPANKSAIQSIEKSFEFAEKAYKVNGVAQFAKLISSQVNTLLHSANKKEKGKYPLNAEENVVYVNLIKKIKPALSEIEFLLDKKDSQEMAIKEELEKIADSLRQLEAKVVEGREDAILDLAKKAVATHDMTDKERAEYENLVRMALSGSQKDTDIIHAHLGSLLMAKNPLLNLAGNTIERMTLLQNEDFQKNWKKLTSKLQALDWKQKDFEAIIDEETFEIINERDAKKVEKVDAQEKEEIKNKVLESLKLVGDFEIEGEPNFEELQLKYPDRQDDLNSFESAYKRAWNKNLSERRESFFKKDFIKAKENHPVKINGEKPEITPLALEAEEQFRKERASIRINAGDNLSPSDQARIKEVDRQQRERENPRNSLTGELYKGIKEVYDEKLERWVVVINEEEFRTLSAKDQEEISTIVGLNHLRYKTQDFYKKRNKERDIPQTFLDRLAELQTTQEKLAFIDTNAFISFPDEFYNQFKDGQGLIDRLREAGEDGLIESIRTQQAIINKIIKLWPMIWIC